MSTAPSFPPPADGPSGNPASCELPRFFQWRARLETGGDFILRDWTCGDGTEVTPELRDRLVAMIPEPERERCAAAYRRAQETGSAYEAEFQLVGADGRIHWFLDLGTACPGSGDPDVLNGVTLDITDRRRQAEVLQEREAMLEAMSELSHDTYWVASLDFRRVHYVSPSYGRHTGLRRDRLANHPMDWFQRVHPDDLDRVRGVLQQIIERRIESFSEECRMLADDGTVRELQLRGRTLAGPDGRVDRLAGLATDITDRRNAERALRLSEERFELANRGSSDGIFDWDIVRRTLYLSPRWKEMLGFTDADLPNSENSWRDRLHPDDRERALGYLSDFLAGSFAAYALEHRLRHRDGSYRWILARGTIVRDALGNPIRMVGAHTDITGRKELEARILAAVEEERRSIGSDLHDDLGQRLTALELMTEALRGQVREDGEAARDAVDQISRGIRETIVRIRRLSHGLAPQTMEPGGLVDALRELARSVEEAAGIRCAYSGPDTLSIPDPEMRTHVYRIAQEAVNNAVRHGRPGRIDVAVAHADRHLAVTVRDDGRGFTPGAVAGAGRGLALMRHRATLVGAILEVVSRPGAGTEVRCQFPKMP